MYFRNGWYYIMSMLYEPEQMLAVTLGYLSMSSCMIGITGSLVLSTQNTRLNCVRVCVWECVRVCVWVWMGVDGCIWVCVLMLVSVCGNLYVDVGVWICVCVLCVDTYST